jgi:predicted acylesterase/phospholipase RssA
MDSRVQVVEECDRTQTANRHEPIYLAAAQAQAQATRGNGDLRMNVLSIRGGGIRGLAPAQFLSQMESALNKPISEYFDLIVGTSTGAILATALGLGIPAAEVVKFYVVDGPNIFKRRLAHRFGLLGSKYNGATLRAALDARFANRLFTQCVVPVAVTTTNVETLKAVVLRSGDGSFTGHAAVAAYCSAAAPTYFDPYKDSNGSYYVDGGLYANNPAIVALHEASQLLKVSTKSGSKVSLLDLGCPRAKITPDIKPGVFGFAPGAISVMMEAGMNFVETFCSDAFGAAYLPVVPELGTASAALDDTSDDNLRALLTMGSKAWGDNAPKVNAFLLASSAVPGKK